MPLRHPPKANVPSKPLKHALLARQAGRARSSARSRSVRTPKRMERSGAALVLIVLVLLVTSGFLCFFGVEDVSEALAYTWRFTGILLILASAIVLLAAVAAVDHWIRRSFAYSGLVALLGSITAAVSGLMLLIVTLRDGDSRGYLLLWTVLAVGSVWASVNIYRTSIVIPSPRRVAAGVAVSAGIAAVNFGYTQLYQPYHAEPNPLLDVTLGSPVLAADKKAFALPVTIRFENRSNVGLYLLAPEFHVMGRTVHLSSTDRLAPQWRNDVEAGNPLSRREVSQPLHLVQANNWAVFGNWLAAHQSFTTTRIVELPTNTPFDQIQVRASTGIARGDRLSIETFGSPTSYSWENPHQEMPKWQAEGTAGYVVYHGRIHENNAIAEHTRDPRFVTIWWNFGDKGAGVSGVIARRGEESRPLTGTETAELANRYGFEFVNKGWVVRSLWDLKQR
ncbi:hypothetical protein [Streptomyces sp. NPDC058964]|uniref:hypothetical protein n=1 Tax=Streptomyces sp. NPDC058964 TaxID=3346681 RepID=UPI0036AD3CD4